MRPSRAGALARALAPFALLAGGAGAAAAQGALLPYDAASAACIANIPADARAVVPVYLEADVATASARPLLPVGDLLADLVADKVRASLGVAPAADGSPGGMPAADSVVGWQELTWLSVTLHRDGRFTWRPYGADSAAAPRGAARLLATALEALAAEGQRLFWPEEVAADSARIELHLHEATVGDGGIATPPTLRFATPLFTVRAPRQTPIGIVRPPSIEYPVTSQRNGATGTVILDFVIGADGRVERESIRDVWPDDRPRLGGELGMYYRAFLRAAERGVAGALFSPARIGPCAVRMQARQQFEYAFPPR